MARVYGFNLFDSQIFITRLVDSFVKSTSQSDTEIDLKNVKMNVNFTPDQTGTRWARVIYKSYPPSSLHHRVADPINKSPLI
jgi:hypothetical protein